MLYAITVTQYNKMLGNLSTILDKAATYAESKRFDVGVLLNSRLAPDQFNLIRQVQIACDTAKFGAARITGKEAPSHADTEATLGELQARIKATQEYLATFKEQDFEGAAERHVSQPRWEGKYLTGLEYTLQHSFPNISFHITTAYSILRSNGVDVGKKDYLGSMPYKQPN
ncbi:MAG: DUF1993 domain-containing protein [Gammaproteobacteria bacterium]|nr:MAG: DUF1993 domain-containing protein [Gammaproteobacteria bacterium]